MSASRRKRAAKLQRAGEDGYRGRIKRVTRRQGAIREKAAIREKEGRSGRLEASGVLDGRGREREVTGERATRRAGAARR